MQVSGYDRHGKYELEVPEYVFNFDFICRGRSIVLCALCITFIDCIETIHYCKKQNLWARAPVVNRMVSARNLKSDGRVTIWFDMFWVL